MQKLISRVLGQVFRLPPAETYDVVVERNVQIRLADGAIGLADHYYARDSRKAPLVLVRSPYGRAGFVGMVFGRFFAERGFQALLCSVRGTFHSGGTFDAFRNERADGIATLEWLKEQPWFGGEIATLGPSYVGFTQWAIAAPAGEMLKAMAPAVTAADFRAMMYPGESFSSDTALTWASQVSRQEMSLRQQLLTQSAAKARLKKALLHLPLLDADEVATGEQVKFYRDWLEHNEPGDPWWDVADFSAEVSSVTAPVHFVSGWYDMFAPLTLADYGRLRAAGQQPYLTVGPWKHQSVEAFPVYVRTALSLFREHLLGDSSHRPNARVRLFVMGANRWRGFETWPPPGYSPQRWHLQAAGGFSPATPAPSEPDHYRYDPASPTPAVGGSSFSENSGPKDNREVEARDDVLLYTSAPLERDLEAIGAISSELYVKSSNEYTDFFARLCDVDEQGKSINISDGLLRLRPGQPEAAADGTIRVVIPMWPTAHVFKQGHSIRVQIASGSHPRWTRNTGSGEPLATATRLVPADQTIYHDPDHPSGIILPLADN